MSLTATEKHDLKEAIYVARQGAFESLDIALAQLNNEFINVDPDKAKDWVNQSVVDAAMGRAPGYPSAWDALLREMQIGKAERGSQSTPVTPEPVEHEDSYETPAPPSVADVVAFRDAVLKVLREQGGQHLSGGKTGFGVPPVQDHDGFMTITGGIVGVSEGNFQNPVRHENLWDICNSDGGMRGLQYGRVFNGQWVRNTANRPLSIFALMDSMGDACLNDSSGSGQALYFVKDPVNKKVIIACYKPGWTIEVRETSAAAPYSAQDVKKL